MNQEAIHPILDEKNIFNERLEINLQKSITKCYQFHLNSQT